MRNKKRTHKKISIKKVIKFINRLLLLLATTTSLLYFIYIIGLSMITYLHNRPIRTAVLCVAFGVVMMFIDEIDTQRTHAKQRKAQARHRQTQAHRQAQAKGVR